MLSGGLEVVLFCLLLWQFAIPWMAANSTAICITFWFNFFLNRVWSFRSQAQLGRQLLLGGLVVTVNLGMSNTILYLLINQAGWDPASAKLISMGLIVVWNFVLYQKVFTAGSPADLWCGP